MEEEIETEEGIEIPIIQEEWGIFSESNEEGIKEQDQDNNQREMDEEDELTNENKELGGGKPQTLQK